MQTGLPGRRKVSCVADNDTDLVARFQREAIPILEGLYRHAMKLTHDHADAEDLLQETAAEAFAGFGSFRDGTNLGGWLYRIMLNCRINRYRRQQRRPVQWLTDTITDGQMMSQALHSSAGLRSAEDLALEHLEDSDIKTAMQALPERMRTTVYLADVEGLRFREIAALTGIPIGTVMSRLHRARRQLRRLLSDVAADRGYRLVDAA